MDTIIPCGSTSSIEKQFQEEYTHAKFKEVQAEFRAKMNCVPSSKNMEGEITTYCVLEDKLFGDMPKDCIFKVAFNHHNHDVSCECSLFEFRGILCRHVLCVCALERVKRVPVKYVLARWSKNIKRKHSYIKSSYSVTKLKPQMDKFDNLFKHFFEVVEEAAENEDSTKVLHGVLSEFKSNLPSLGATTVGIYSQSIMSPLQVQRDENNITTRDENLVPEIHSPLRVIRKGRPPSKRKMSMSSRFSGVKSLIRLEPFNH